MQKLIIALVLVALGVGGYFAYQSMNSSEAPNTDTVLDKDIPDIAEPRVDEKPEEFVTEAAKTAEGDNPQPVTEAGPELVLAGTVYGPNGDPVEDAEITLLFLQQDRDAMSGDGNLKVDFKEDIRGREKSDARGRYEFKFDQAQGAYLFMRLRADGYVTMIKDHVGPGMSVDFHLVNGGRMVGQITDIDSGEPVPNARVEANFRNDAVTMHRYYRWREVVRTNAKGEYTFDGTPAGSVTLLVEHEDYEQFFVGQQQPIELATGRDNRFDFQVKRGVVMEGLVVDANTKRPVAKAEVLLSTTVFLPSQRQTTGVLGKFKMKGVQRGVHNVKIRAANYSLFSEQVKFDDDDEKPVVFKLLPSGTATGTVVDEDGQPLAGVDIFVAEKVALFNQVRDYSEAKTDSEGRFSVGGLNHLATYVMSAHIDGWTINSSDPIEAQSGQNVDDVIIQLEKGATVRGKVTDEFGVPLAGAKVIVEKPPYMHSWFAPGLGIGQKETLDLVADEDGVFQASSLYTGVYNVTAEHDDYVPDRARRFQITTGNEQVNENFKLKLGRSIEGRVTDSFGNIVRGAKIAASIGFVGQNSQPVRSATTDEEGRYKITRLEDRAYRVRAESEVGVSPALSDVPSDSSGIDFILQPWGTLQGRVVSRTSGLPVNEFTIMLKPIPESLVGAGKRDLSDRQTQKKMAYDEAAREEKIRTTDGNFEIKKVHPREYIVQVTSDTHRDAEATTVVSPGEVDAMKAFVLTDGGRFEGSLKTSDGNPVSRGVTLRLTAAPGGRIVTTRNPDGTTTREQRSSNWRGKSVTPDANGFFSVGGLPPGNVVVRFISQDFCCPSSQEMQFDEGTTTRDYTVFRAAKATLQVVDDTGVPVPNATASVRTLDDREAQVDGRRVITRGDSSGNLRIAKIAPGSYRVLVRRTGFDPKDVEITVEEGEHAVQEVQLLAIR